MIRSFGDKETAKVWKGDYSRKLPTEIQGLALRKLRLINNASFINELRAPPANRLEKLKGDLEGYHSIRINRQWRIIFQWEEGDAHNLKIIDYH
ncbi:MAG: type II toxin-antitoxin system RelE/ParE family toxin [Bacteroidota bacterium]